MNQDTRGRTCINCVEKIHLAPFRLCAIGSEDSPTLRTITPDLPAHLQSLLPIALSAESQARYGVRMMRQGFIYVFAKRVVQGWKLDGASTVLKDGNLGHVQASDSAQNVRELLVNPGTQTASIYVMEVRDPGGVQEMRVLFTPTALTRARIDDILQNKIAVEGGEGLRDMLQKIDIAAILADPNAHSESVIPRDRINDTVAELIALKKWGHTQYVDPGEDISSYYSTLMYSSNAGLRILQNQFHAYQTAATAHSMEYAIQRIPQKLDPVGRPEDNRSTAQGVGIALTDPIGITQDLNHWRNMAWTTFKTDYLAKQVQGPGGNITNERRVSVGNVLCDLNDRYPVFQKYAQLSAPWKAYIGHKESLLRSVRGYMHDQLTAEFLIDHDVNGEADVLHYLQSQRMHSVRLKESVRNIQRAWQNFDEETRAAFPDMVDASAISPPPSPPSSSQVIAPIDEEDWDEDGDTAPASSSADEPTPAGHAQEPSAFEAQYGHLFDMAALGTFQSEYQAEFSKAETRAAPRLEAHLVWLTSDTLKNTFDYYDPDSDINGLLFASQVGLCMLGMGNTSRGYELINGWLEERGVFAEDTNLLGRAVMCNRGQIKESIGDLMDDILIEEEMTVFDADTVQKATALAETFSKLFALADGRVQHGVSLGAVDQAGLYAVIHYAQIGMLKAAGPKAIDKGMYQLLRTYLMGSITQDIMGIQQWNDQNRKLVGNYWRQPLRDIEDELDAAWKQAAHNQRDFARVRLAGIMVSLQCVNTIMQLKALSESGRPEQILNAFGAMFSTAAALSELCATFTEAALHNLRQMDFRYSDYETALASRSARYKYWGAALGTVGSSLTFAADVVADGPKLLEEWRKGHKILATTYGVKLTASGLLLIGSLDGALNKRISTWFAQLALKGAAENAERALGAMALRAAATRGMAYRVAGGLGALILSEGALLLYAAAAFAIPVGVDVYFVFRDDPTTLADWSEKCTFGKAGGRPYKDVHEELDKFRVALLKLTEGVPPTLKEIEYHRESRWMQTNFPQLQREAEDIWRRDAELERQIEKHTPVYYDPD